MADPKSIYDELFKRARIIEWMLRTNVMSYYKVFELIKSFYVKGEASIPLYG